MAKLPGSWALPTTIKNRLGQRSAGKQRAMVAEGHLLLVLHAAPQAQESERRAVFFWRSPSGQWQNSGGQYGIKPLVKHLQAYSDGETALSDAYGQAKSAGDFFQLLEAIAPLRRASENLYSTLQAAREGIPDDPDLIDLRDWADEIHRSLTLLYESTNNAMNYNIARRAEEQTALSLAALTASDRLNIIAALFLPITALASIFGMNLIHGWETVPGLAFWSVLMVGMILGMGVRYWVLKGR